MGAGWTVVEAGSVLASGAGGCAGKLAATVDAAGTGIEGAGAGTGTGCFKVVGSIAGTNGLLRPAAPADAAGAAGTVWTCELTAPLALQTPPALWSSGVHWL
mmetsp:Transcript_15559/g.42398  ORF Transcript_15559/g.42398 Transcript_15559/m.42398 type:complete len:102 (-) Transcript_15559:427-732(-)